MKHPVFRIITCATIAVTCLGTNFASAISTTATTAAASAAAASAANRKRSTDYSYYGIYDKCSPTYIEVEDVVDLLIYPYDDAIITDVIITDENGNRVNSEDFDQNNRDPSRSFDPYTYSFTMPEGKIYITAKAATTDDNNAAQYVDYLSNVAIDANDDAAIVVTCSESQAEIEKAQDVKIVSTFICLLVIAVSIAGVISIILTIATGC